MALKTLKSKIGIRKRNFKNYIRMFSGKYLFNIFFQLEGSFQAVAGKVRARYLTVF